MYRNCKNKTIKNTCTYLLSKFTYRWCHSYSISLSRFISPPNPISYSGSISSSSSLSLEHFHSLSLSFVTVTLLNTEPSSHLLLKDVSHVGFSLYFLIIRFGLCIPGQSSPSTVSCSGCHTCTHTVSIKHFLISINCSKCCSVLLLYSYYFIIYN